jgi:hypothetical protein
MNSFHLIDVGLKGNNKFFIEDSITTISGLKFNTTSYNN